MFRRIFSCGSMLLLVGVAILMTPGISLAQHRGGGGHIGGGHIGGARFGGTHFGGTHFAGTHFGSIHGGHFGGAHFAATRFSGYHGGFYHGGYHYGYGRYHPYYGYHHYYHPYYGYGYYPYYDAYPYLGSGVATDPGYGGYYAEVAPSYLDGTTSVTPPAAGYGSYYAPATGTDQPDGIAYVTVNVPADARVWFEGAATTSTGPVRQFYSPPLVSGSQYTYDIKASWNENGHEVTQTQKVEVTAAAHVNVDFPVPPKAAGQASADTHS